MKTNPIKLYKIVREEAPAYNCEEIKIKGSKYASELVKEFLFKDCMQVHEEFWTVLLNNSNEVQGYFKVSQGGITGTVVDVRLVAKAALDTLATSVILCHNHPSGTLKPSEADIRITKKIQEGLALLDVKVLDHVIVTKDDYFSFADNQML